MRRQVKQNCLPENCLFFASTYHYKVKMLIAQYNGDRMMTPSVFRFVLYNPCFYYALLFLPPARNLTGKWKPTGNVVRLAGCHSFYLLACLHYGVNQWIQSQKNTFSCIILRMWPIFSESFFVYVHIELWWNSAFIG